MYIGKTVGGDAARKATGDGPPWRCEFERQWRAFQTAVAAWSFQE